MSEKNRGRRLFARWLPIPVTGGLITLAACSAPGKGALIMAISTDMQAPKDISTVSIYVTEGPVVKFDYVGRVSPLGTVSLPSTLALVEPDDPNTQIGIRVIGYNQQTAKVLRDIQTTVPHQRTALLRVPLDFIDLNSVPAPDGMGNTTLPTMYYPGSADGAPEGISTFDPDTIPSTCDPMLLCRMPGEPCMTTLNGACGSAVVQSSALPDYQDSLVFGTNGSAAGENCFDVQSCFTDAAPVTNIAFSGTSAMPGTCTFALPTGGGVLSDGGPTDAAVDAEPTQGDSGAPITETDASTITSGGGSGSGGSSSGGSSSGGAPASDSGEVVGGAGCGTTTCTGDTACCTVPGQGSVCLTATQCTAAVAASEGAQPHDAGVQSVEIALSDAVDAGALQAPNDSGVSTGGGSSGGASGSGAGSTGGSSTSGSSTGAASSYLNFAIVTQGAGATGACNAQGECFVPIENDPNEGWSVTGNTVTLAAGLCSQLNPQLGGQAQLFFVDNGTNQACQTKTDSQPVCEAAQLMGDGGASADDASREGPDTGVVMAADGGSSGMHMGGGPQDASAPITGGPDSSTSGGGSSGGTGFSGGDAGSSGTKDAGTSSAELTGVASLAAGPYTTCAVMQNGGTVDCWGLVLGNVTPTPEPMPGLSNVSTGALGGNMTNGFACALEGNAVLCEGSNSSGELGNGSNVDSNTPVAVTGITSSPTAVGAGAGFACALLSTGTVECWGDNVSGDLGNPDASTPSPNPVPVVNLTDATGLAVGSDFACALIAGGSVECWGDNTYGILGSDEAGTSSNVPVIVSGFGGEAVTSLAAGQNHVCALTAKGTIYCWGDNTYNQLGTGGGTEMQSYTPVIATPVGVTALAAGGNENCVIVQGAGQVACWGSDSDGQIGNGVAPGGTSEQITMTGVVNATAIVVGGDHACALVQNGSVECWGYNAAGEIGTGQSTPTTVLSPTFVVPAGNGGAGNDAAIEP